MESVNLNDNILVKLYNEGEYDKPIEITDNYNDTIMVRILFNRGEATKLVAVLTQYLENNNA